MISLVIGFPDSILKNDIELITTKKEDIKLHDLYWFYIYISPYQATYGIETHPNLNEIPDINIPKYQIYENNLNHRYINYLNTKTVPGPSSILIFSLFLYILHRKRNRYKL